MLSSIKVDVHYTNEPIIKIKVQYPEGSIEDVRDRLIHKIINPAAQLKDFSAFDGIAGQDIIRRGALCTIEQWTENEFILRSYQSDKDSLINLRNYIDALIDYEQSKHGSCGIETISASKRKRK